MGVAVVVAMVAVEVDAEVGAEEDDEAMGEIERDGVERGAQ